MFSGSMRAKITMVGNLKGEHVDSAKKDTFLLSNFRGEQHQSPLGLEEF